MEVVNLLKFLNSVHDLYTLDYARCDRELMNFLEFMNLDEQFTRTIDLGLVFVSQNSIDQYVIVDGLSRVVSLSLLLHAVCECYKKTTNQNAKAIKTIRSKYLFSGNSKFKLHLQEEDAALYKKIINGEKLSGREKSKPMFVLLHSFWTKIKEDNLRASDIFKMLQKINVTIVETESTNKRDLYYSINKEKRNIDQIALIDNFIKENGVTTDWEEIKTSYCLEKSDLPQFLKDFFITRYNYKAFNSKLLYDSFVNYFETMMQYISEDNIMKNLKRSAMLYFNIININFKNEDIRKAFINIKRHDGSDTYPYILNVYEDFYTGNISESIFIEILNTIDEYLVNRQNSGKNINFNELVQYLNALITYK